MSKWGGRQCVQSACSIWFLWGKVSQALLFKLQTQTSHHHQIFHSVLKVVWNQGGVCWGVDESFWSAGRGNRSWGAGKVRQFKNFTGSKRLLQRLNFHVCRCRKLTICIPALWSELNPAPRCRASCASHYSNSTQALPDLVAAYGGCDDTIIDPFGFPLRFKDDWFR